MNVFSLGMAGIVLKDYELYSFDFCSYMACECSCTTRGSLDFGVVEASGPDAMDVVSLG